MPREVINQTLYQDRTVQNWHRRVMPADADAIDLDLVGCCKRCRKPLYFIESTTNEEKGTYYMREIALANKSPALLVLHRAGEIVAWHTVSPRFGDWTYSPLEDYLISLRASHLKEHHLEGEAA